jgi:hypothetical protein
VHLFGREVQVLVAVRQQLLQQAVDFRLASDEGGEGFGVGRVVCGHDLLLGLTGFETMESFAADRKAKGRGNLQAHPDCAAAWPKRALPGRAFLVLSRHIAAIVPKSTMD